MMNLTIMILSIAALIQVSISIFMTTIQMADILYHNCAYTPPKNVAHNNYHIPAAGNFGEVFYLVIWRIG